MPVLGLFFGRAILRAATTACVGYGIIRFITGKTVLERIRRRTLKKEF
jgi:hypothetical protein